MANMKVRWLTDFISHATGNETTDNVNEETSNESTGTQSTGTD